MRKFEIEKQHESEMSNNNHSDFEEKMTSSHEQIIHIISCVFQHNFEAFLHQIYCAFRLIRNKKKAAGMSSIQNTFCSKIV